MSTPGWYPDPAGMPNRLRYWDGGSWTTQVSDNSASALDAGIGHWGKGWLWAALAGGLVLALVAVMVIWNPIKDALVAGLAPTYSPTVSARNASVTPTPATPSPSIAKLRCGLESKVRRVGYLVNGSRLEVGPMSMPVPSGWQGPRKQTYISYGKGAYGYTKGIERHGGRLTWFNTMAIGPTNFTKDVSLETQARTIIACLAGTTPMSRYKAPKTLNLKAITISGHDAVQADAVYSWKYRDLNSKGSLIRVVVVETADGPYYFLGEATKERSDIIKVMNKLSAGLAIS